MSSLLGGSWANDGWMGLKASQIFFGMIEQQKIEATAPPHATFDYRYVPDVKMLQTAKLRYLIPALGKHIDVIEQQFEVWTDTRDPALG